MPKISWENYEAKKVFDEYVGNNQKLRPETKIISNFISKYSRKKLLTTIKSSENAISQRGVTFRVYSNDKITDHYWPLRYYSQNYKKEGVG
jgi:uncharacterized circularly permuted ATP-grasp superfamily protein